MAYDLFITRQNKWFGDDEAKQIPIQEWLDYLFGDATMRWVKLSQIKLPVGETFKIEQEAIRIWQKDPGHKQCDFAWVIYHNGHIIVKNPDLQVIDKLQHIAFKLQAKVQYENGNMFELHTNSPAAR